MQTNSFAEGYAVGRDTNGYNNGMWGGEWGGLIGLLIVASLFGNGGWGFGGNGQRGGYATTQDLASGFANSEIMSDLNSIILGQATMQNFINQGFNGLNTAILQSANATERGFAQAGYNLANCCCELKGAISDVKFANEKQTCDIINAINAGNQRLVDIYTSDKIEALRAENVALKGRISNDAQSAYIINSLAPACPKPAYIVPNPNCCYTNNGVSIL